MNGVSKGAELEKWTGPPEWAWLLSSIYSPSMFEDHRNWKWAELAKTNLLQNEHEKWAGPEGAELEKCAGPNDSVLHLLHIELEHGKGEEPEKWAGPKWAELEKWVEPRKLHYVHNGAGPKWAEPNLLQRGAELEKWPELGKTNLLHNEHQTWAEPDLLQKGAELEKWAGPKWAELVDDDVDPY